MGTYMTREDQIDFCTKHGKYSWDWYDSLPDNQLYAIYMELYEDVMDAYYEGEMEKARRANEYDDEVVSSRLAETNYVIDSPDKMPKKADGTVDFEALNRLYAGK